MRRREFITLVGSTAMIWPFAARAQQQPAMPVIGFLSSLTSDNASNMADAFRQGATETGFAEGQSVKYEYRFANGDNSLLATMTDELVHRPVAIIAAGAPPAALAAKAATSTIPSAQGTHDHYFGGKADIACLPCNLLPTNAR